MGRSSMASIALNPTSAPPISAPMGGLDKRDWIAHGSGYGRGWPTRTHCASHACDGCQGVIHD